MTDTNQGLDEILALLGAKIPQPKTANEATARVAMLQETKQALLDWHNKQVEAVLDRLWKNSPKNSWVEKSDLWYGFDDGVKDYQIVIEAERARLKEAK